MHIRRPSLAESSVLLLIATLVVATLALSRQEQHAREVVFQRTLDDAAVLAHFTRAAHAQYSESTEGAHGSGMNWTTEDVPPKGSIHFPATFSRLLTEEVSRALKDTNFRIYSTDPFTIEGYSDFEETAIAALSEGDRESFWRVETWPGGIEMVRFATPIRMSESCITCHGNGRLDASDWNTGDVRGIWEVGIQLPETALRSPPERAMLIGLVFLCSVLGLMVVYPVVRHEVGRRTHFEALSGDLMALAETDPLSGLANRRGFDDALAHAIHHQSEASTQMGLIVLDIDHFKSVNDTHGHDVGDIVIRELGGIIRDEIRSCDFAARIGGEEFAVICPDVSQKDLARVSERVRASIERAAFSTPVGPVSVTVSAGATLLQPKEDHLGLFRRTDLLLLKAKETGRNMVCFGEVLA